MTLDQLSMFVAVADTGTFSAAAKKLHISQPSISVAIKSLEEELKVILLDRNSYRPTLTVHGQEIYQQAKQMLALQQEIKTTATHLAQGEEKHLRIVIDIVSPLPQILRIIKNYFTTENSCKIELSFCVLGSGFSEVEKNLADLYVGPMFADAGLRSINFHSHYHMVPVIGGESPFALLPLNRLKECIESIPRVILRGGKKEDGGKKTPRELADEGRDIFVEDYLIKKETILSGLGWGRLPLWNIESELKNGSLIDIRTIFPHMKIVGDIFVVPKAKNQGKHLKALLELLKGRRAKKSL